MKRTTLTLLGFLLMCYSPGYGQETSCKEQPEVLIVSNTAENNQFICRAASKAIDFLSRLQLFPQRKITIEIVDYPLYVQGVPAYGFYDGQADLVQLMSFRSISKELDNPMIFGERFDREHFFGAVAHEVTHAVIHHQTVSHPVSVSLQEYFAYSVQLAVLPSQRRSAIFKRMAIDAWMPGDTISAEYMAIEPGFFAVKSYKHLMALGDPSSFIKRLLLSKQMFVYIPEVQTIY